MRKQSVPQEEGELIRAYSNRFPGAAARLAVLCLKENLTKKQKYYIILYYRNKMTIPEIARLCGVNRSTVSRTIRRGMDKLRPAMHRHMLADMLGGSGCSDSEEDTDIYV